MVALDPATEKLLDIYNNAICVVFLIDFASNLRRTTSKDALHRPRWLDLLGSIPFGIFNGASDWRLAACGSRAQRPEQRELPTMS
jgi:hypothetical protein